MDRNIKNQKLKRSDAGFTLLLAITITSMLLLVSFVVANLALKQLSLSFSSQESQFAFYSAESGTECAVYWDIKNPSGVSAFDTSTPGNISCNGQNGITTGSQTVPTIPSQSSLVGGGGNGSTNIFWLNFTKGCAIVRVTKATDGSGVTTITSRGYNTCSLSSPRRFERGITLTYVSNTVSSLYSGLIAYWTLNESAGATSFTDSSGNGKTGTCSGTGCPVAGVAGKLNTAASFDGTNDIISASDSSLWTFSGDFTISLWVKANSWGGNWWTRAFLGQDEGGGPTNKWIFSYDGTRTIFHINTSSGGGPVALGNTWTPSTGTWYHLAVTRQGNNYTFYRDGSPDGVWTDSTIIPDASAPLTIGWAEGVGSFNGTIDDVRIYNRALSGSEISQLFGL